MNTTTNPGIGEHDGPAHPSSALRWTFSVLAILVGGIAGYLLAYSVGTLIGGDADLSPVVLQLLGGFFAGALCVVSMRFASKHTPRRHDADVG